MTFRSWVVDKQSPLFLLSLLYHVVFLLPTPIYASYLCFNIKKPSCRITFLLSAKWLFHFLLLSILAYVIENLNGILAIGIGIGLMTVVGETLGAGRKEEAVYYIKKLCIIAEITLVISCLVFYLLVRPITYFGGMEPESAKLCIYMVTWISIVKPIVWIMAFIPAYGLRAAGDVKFSMAVSVLSMWFCRVSLVIFLARAFHMGPMAVWIGMFVDWTVRNIIFTIRFRSRKWLNHEVI